MPGRVLLIGIGLIVILILATGMGFGIASIALIVEAFSACR